MLTPKRTREQTDACQSLKAPGMERKSMFSCIYSEQFMPINVMTSELSNSNFRITPFETGLQLQLEKNHPRRIVLFHAMLRKSNIVIQIRFSWHDSMFTQRFVFYLSREPVLSKFSAIIGGRPTATCGCTLTLTCKPVRFVDDSSVESPTALSRLRRLGSFMIVLPFYTLDVASNEFLRPPFSRRLCNS